MILEILAQAGAVAATGFGGPGGIWAHIVNDEIMAMTLPVSAVGVLI